MKTKTSIHHITFAYVILITVILCSCTPLSQPQNESNKKIKGGYEVKVIDSCEYIEYDWGVLDQRVYSLTHKGNCKFCAERNKK